MAHAFSNGESKSRSLQRRACYTRFYLGEQLAGRSAYGLIMLVFVITMLNIVAIPFGKLPIYVFLSFTNRFQVMPTTLSGCYGLPNCSHELLSHTWPLHPPDDANDRNKDHSKSGSQLRSLPLAQAFLIVSPSYRPEDGMGDTRLPYWLAPFVSVAVVLGGVVLWWIWRIVIPYAGYFSWIPQETKPE